MEIYKNLLLEDLDGEIWKTIEDFPDYSVSNIGRIKRIIPDKWNHKLKVLKQDKRNGYFYVILCKNGKEFHKYSHRLVYETYIGKLEDGYNAHHVNGDRKNNFVDNLKSIPESEHHSFHTKGEKHPSHKLTEQNIIQIELLLKDGNLNNREIGELFGVSPRTISHIKTGDTWKWI